ncbi:nitrite reductase small subunit NirD [Halobacillus amylolyticus]|uniref:Nitrite reductase small subunit NirD n=1 Tax=Halobacillus amylolyticus TaxID=2932259 RepID=A0ABY4HC48_9BACI|nr:nitrite reductase small subunit NirD [Halobacillus amylolyticus]UOR12136.1 nitrite reductase small subunit NirD [Halobacillus amylolyticus]
MEKLLNKIFVAKVNELPEKLGRTVHVHGLELAIFKLVDGDIRVIENRCPHKGGVLAEGMISGEHVFCPMHDWKISVVDGKVQKPDIGCVQTFEVKVEKDNVYVMLPEK